MARILLFGSDSRQLETRQWFLKRLYDSVAVCSIAEFKAQAAQGNVDLMLFCETLPQEDACSARVFSHEVCPTAKILVLHEETRTPSLAKVSGVLDGSSLLLQQVAEHLKAA